MARGRFLCSLSILLLAGLPAACVPQRPAISGESLVVLRGATLIDGTGGPARPDSEVILDGPRIVAVGARGGFEFADDAQVVDLSGAWILPGFVDAHTHIDAEVLDTYLSFGVTAVRNAAGTPEVLELRDRIDAGELRGPRVITAGPAIQWGTDEARTQFVSVDGEAAMRDEVRLQHELGFDFIKLYRTLPPALVAAGIDEAHSLGMWAVGHLRRTYWQDAAAAGIDGLTHWAMYGALEELFPAASRAGFEAARGDNAEPPPRDPWSWCGGSLFERFAQEVRTDSAEVRAFVAAMADNDIIIDPTLVLEEAVFWGRDREARERLEVELAPAVHSDAEWWGFPHSYSAYCRDESVDAAQAAFPALLTIVRLLHEAGVRMAVGSDYPNAWMTPGVSFHRELELLVSAGIPTSDVLVMGTRSGAQAMGLEAEIGTIEAGKSADLVVLEADPLVDIRNTRRIRAVIVRGEIARGTKVARSAGRR